ncbi:hypothetical protein D3C84_1219840 [compost metagenome]
MAVHEGLGLIAFHFFRVVRVTLKITTLKYIPIDLIKSLKIAVVVSPVRVSVCVCKNEG